MGTESQFGFVAGERALDLLNTVHWRLDPGRRLDALAQYSDVLAWSRLAGLLSTAETDCLADIAQQDTRVADRELSAVRALREAAYSAIWQHDDDASKHITIRHHEAMKHAQLAEVDGRWEWRDNDLQAGTPKDRLARTIVAYMTSVKPSLVSQCADEACGWLYIDTSRRGNRRWCAASGCGDRNRAKDYYRRKSSH